jgi:hypothetical protein
MSIVDWLFGLTSNREVRANTPEKSAAGSSNGEGCQALAMRGGRH